MRQPPRDVNAEIGGLLYDLSNVQTSTQHRHAYNRAAKAVLRIDQPIETMAPGQLRSIRFIGPSTERIILEYLANGASATVEAAVDRSGRRAVVEQQRGLRATFLSYAAVRRALAPRRTTAIDPASYRGDFQMHSEWSDGAESLESLSAGCLARGYTCACITDHSYGLPIAGGMTMDEVRRQHAELDRLNKRYRGRFRFFKGIEANIKADGTLDLQPSEIQLFELVVASPHSLLRKPFSQTDRMLTAVSTPHVHILGHPRGRMYSRSGVVADWDAVFRAAAARGVAVEIDGDWWRQDLDYALARKAFGYGCVFALDSDAHSSGELAYIEYALAHARLADIPAKRVINCWSDEEILAWTDRLRK
jgi:histidinol phosphatase-like PHP family hydrolase